ncbi:hypothetical protein CEUSTIGMA_g7369.t1 [Chlamydomonas eustigma]|uniref:Exocyst complex component EXOC2/Sec5 N-terminal domain-containing protein n=1 Tax=Chlamydomonas eustigma TaxID=1157962 RepID=A0A250XAK7_9CHLO|nr:hypothetical protein CEUSTIGMA_g7369.t1 [Chlamydomonas eustigma]|eukprot:GAX79929.1 hypothetical protein CEUSTIGMA_g7369.t1 [Chlamydomonas eustigma]
MSDDDISIISLSDDELGNVVGATGKGSAPIPLGHAPSFSMGKALKSAPAPINSTGSYSKTAPSKKAVERRVEPVYEDDEQQYSDDQDYEDEGEDKYDELYRERVLDEDGLEYISNRFADRQRDGTGPSTWLEVDEEEIREVAENLLQNIHKAHHSENVLQQIFMSSAVAATKEMQDPLGMGSFDPVNLKLRNKLSDEVAEELPLVNNKWHRDRSAKQRAAMGAGDDGEGTSGEVGAGVRQLLPPEISPFSDSFDPELYLATFHVESTLSQLRKGMRHLDNELSERTGQLKQLIKSNFERFISCKGTIDDIYLKLKKVETDKTGGTLTLLRAIEQTQETADQTFGEVLQRATKTDRIKSVTSLLRRFSNLFGIPGRIKVLAQEGDLQQIVREYRKANSLIKPSASTARVWITLYQEIEKRVTEVYNQARSRLEDPGVSVEEVPQLIVFLAELAAEKLPGTREEDPMRLYLECVQDQILQYFQDCQQELEVNLANLESQLHKVEAPASDRARGRNGALGGSFISKKASGAHSQQQQQVQGTSSSNPDVTPAAAAAAASARCISRKVTLLLWPGPPDWSPLLSQELPSHLSLALPARLGLTLNNLSSSASTALPLKLGSSPLGVETLLLNPPSNLSLPSASAPDHLPHTHSSDHGSMEALKRVFTPCQMAQVSSLAHMSYTTTNKLPTVWIVGTSKKYAQAFAALDSSPKKKGSGSNAFASAINAETSKGSAQGLAQAVQLCQELISNVLGRLVAHADAVLAELQPSGPLQPCIELVIMDLVHTWTVLHEAGCPDPSLKELRACVFRALGMYTRELALYLRTFPSALFEEEDWSFGAAARGTPPVTTMPRKLQNVISFALRCHGFMLKIVRQVSEPPKSASWQLLQEGFFSAFQTFCDSAASFSSKLSLTAPEEGVSKASSKTEQSRSHRKGKTREHGQGQAVTKLLPHDPTLGSRPDQGPSSAQAGAYGNDVDEDENEGEMWEVAGSNDYHSDFGADHNLADVDGQLSQSSLSAPGDGPFGEGGDVVLNRRGGGAARGITGSGGPSWTAAVSGHDAKLLAVMSNTSFLRTQALPALVEQHHVLLSGNKGQGEAQLQELLQAASSQLGSVAGSLLSLYLDRKVHQLSKAVLDYLASVKSFPKPYQDSQSNLASLQLTTLSDGFQLVLSRFLSVYTEVFAYSPSSLNPVVVTVAHHLGSALTAGYHQLEVKHLEAEDVLQLVLDLMFLDEIISGPHGDGVNGVNGRSHGMNGGGEKGGGKKKGVGQGGSGEGVGKDGYGSNSSLTDAYLSLAHLVLKVTGRKGFKARTKEVKSLLRVGDQEGMVAAVKKACFASLSAILHCSSFNIKCFL